MWSQLVWGHSFWIKQIENLAFYIKKGKKHMEPGKINNQTKEPEDNKIWQLTEMCLGFRRASKSNEGCPKRPVDLVKYSHSILHINVEEIVIK